MKKPLMHLIALGLTALSLNLAAATPTWLDAQQVKIVIPYPPGSEPDILARELGQALHQDTGQNVIVENRPGANGMIGINYVTKAKGDGSTLLFVDTLALATNPLLFKSVSYNWETDLKPITSVAGTHLYLIVKKDFPAQNYGEFIQYAKQHAGEINVGTGGQGHVTHLSMGQLGQQEGVSFTYIPYRGLSPASNALLGGEVDALLAGGLLAVQHMQSDKTKVLAVGAEKRTALLPNIPTISESGGPAQANFSTTFSLFGPKELPDAMQEALATAVAQAVNSSAMQNSFKNRGLIQVSSSPTSIQTQIRQDQQTYKELLPVLGIKPE